MGDHFGGLRIFWSYASGFQVPWEKATYVFLRQVIHFVKPCIIYQGHVLRWGSAIMQNQNFCSILSPGKQQDFQPSMLNCRTVDSKACQKCAGFVSIPWMQCERSKKGKLQMRAQCSRSSFEDSLCLSKCIVPAAAS